MGVDGYESVCMCVSVCLSSLSVCTCLCACYLCVCVCVCVCVHICVCVCVCMYLCVCLSSMCLPVCLLCVCLQFNSKTLIIPQGAILLWPWWAHKKYIKLREQYNKQKSLTLTVVINLEQLWLHHKIVMKLRSHLALSCHAMSCAGQGLTIKYSKTKYQRPIYFSASASDIALCGWLYGKLVFLLQLIA